MSSRFLSARVPREVREDVFCVSFVRSFVRFRHDTPRLPRKINYADVEHASESRLVTPNTYASLATLVVTSLGSYGAPSVYP